MEKRFYEFSELYNNSVVNTGCKDCRNNDSRIPSCVNDDFCVGEPECRNDGILAMAFVDMQPLESVYPEATALCNGTLFPNLNKPFYGGNKR